MGLNKSTGNMYDFITHTWNTIKGECYHDCSYCYMKRWGKLNPVRFDKKELKTDLGKDNFIFVGSSNDMFADNINDDWIIETLHHCRQFSNKYLFQTKNPEKLYAFRNSLPINTVVCTTFESNIVYSEIQNKSPNFVQRSTYMNYLKRYGFKTYVTIEPIMDFELLQFIEHIKICAPTQVNIGADSGNNNLPEPPKEKILELISELEKFTKVKQKNNLVRLLK